MSGGTPWPWGPIALSRSRSRPRLWSRWSPRSSRRKKAARRKAADPMMPVKHDSLREGARLGFIVATSIWIWLAVVDAVVGQPFRTFTVLGGIALFTAMHYLLNVAYGVLVVSGIHGAVREPSLVMAVAFGFPIVEFVFALVTVLISNLGLGELAWVRIFGGSLIGTAIAIAILARRHPLAAELRQAEEEDNG